jgi:hypothetical protein
LNVRLQYPNKKAGSGCNKRVNFPLAKILIETEAKDLPHPLIKKKIA